MNYTFRLTFSLYVFIKYGISITDRKWTNLGDAVILVAEYKVLSTLRALYTSYTHIHTAIAHLR